MFKMGEAEGFKKCVLEIVKNCIHYRFMCFSFLSRVKSPLFI